MEETRMADSGEPLAMETFQAEVAAWLEANFPPSLRGKAVLASGEADGGELEADLKLWRQRIGATGWGTPTWPKAYGGGGLTAQQARVLSREMARVGAFNPLLFGMGVTMIGPTILDYGTEAQKQTHIPRIVRGEVRWCVGYSEPNAGSDLASLQMRCEDAGDHWRINGQKIWTSGADRSDWCGALVRTDPSAKKHEGISFMLVDMHQSGVETRPIKLVSGASPFCETFFTDATAPKESLLGPLNGGWTVGKRLLQHERASQTGAAMGGGRAKPLAELARAYDGATGDVELMGRVNRNAMDARAHGLTLERAAAEARGNSGPGFTPSILKNSATGVAQNRAELTLETMGAHGLGWDGEGFSADELEAVKSWLFGKAMSIYGGSAEIQNNIISKRILGLPERTQGE
jgi:alkylation response protein AidB-like acyl-CoA dehydrogenase